MVSSVALMALLILASKRSADCLAQFASGRAVAVLLIGLLTGSVVLLPGSLVDAPAVGRVVVWRSAGVVVLVLSVVGSAVVAARVVLFSTLPVDSTVLLSVVELVVDGLVVVAVVP